jgi:hypothetical protein
VVRARSETFFKLTTVLTKLTVFDQGEISIAPFVPRKFFHLVDQYESLDHIAE